MSLKNIKTTHVYWVEKTFEIKRPPNPVDIIKETPEIGNEDTGDLFFLWCNKQFRLR